MLKASRGRKEDLKRMLFSVRRKRSLPSLPLFSISTNEDEKVEKMKAGFARIIIAAIAAVFITAGSAALAQLKETWDGGKTWHPEGTYRPQRQQAPPSNYTPPPSNQQQQRTREEERKAREEEETKRKIAEVQKRHEEFEKGKNEALKLLKGADTSEFDLKGFDKGSDLGLKDATVSATGLKDINSDSSVVDLKHLDPDKPITVDPNVVKGKERKIPVQVLDKTLNNEYYVKGFDAIKAGNHSLAVQYFKRAQVELPNDVMVKNGLGLAEDLERVHGKEASKETSNMSNREAHKGFQAMLAHDYDTAIRYYESAAKIDPSNRRLREEVTFLQGVKTGVNMGMEGARTAGQKALAEKSGKILDNAFIAWQRRDYDTSILLLETALSINPNNQKIRDTIDFVKETQNKVLNSQNEQRKSPAKN
jgi:tetratricopeptide (TPR) repeat protein